MAIQKIHGFKYKHPVCSPDFPTADYYFSEYVNNFFKNKFFPNDNSKNYNIATKFIGCEILIHFE